MNSLGHIPLSATCSLIEARRKIQRVSQTLSGDSLIATRMATITSQAGRDLMRSADSAGIDVLKESAANEPAIDVAFSASLSKT